MNFSQIFASKAYKNFMAKLYGFGAAVVIIGALFKINHFPGANLMLILGMGTEAVIFFFSAFEPLHEEVDWTIVYPELAGLDGNDPNHHYTSNTRTISQSLNPEENRLLSDKLDDLLKGAHIDASLISSLSDGLQKLNSTAKNLNASTDIISINSHYAEELTRLTESLGNLNELYIRQLAASSAQMEATAKAQENMSRIAETLSGTLQSSAQYKEEIEHLSEKVSSLNKIYGGMLSAMNVGNNPKA